MSEALAGVASLVAAFLLGAIPTAYIAGRLLSKGDIRGFGSGNPGALNAARRLGAPIGVLVLLADAGKGILAVAVAQTLSLADVWIYAAALMATLGHNFSPALRFRGGKGAATALGISAFMLWQITMLSAVSGLLMLAATRKPVLSVAWIFFALNALTIGTGQSTGQIVLCLAMSALVAGTHLARQYEEVSESVRTRDWRRFMEID